MKYEKEFENFYNQSKSDPDFLSTIFKLVITALQLTERQLAKRIGVSQSTISRLLNSKNKPSKIVIEKIFNNL